MKTDLKEVSKEHGSVKHEITFGVSEDEAINLFESDKEVFYSVPNDETDVLVVTEEQIREAGLLHYDLFIKKYYI